MGYFSSGTEGMDYEARYCARCRFYADGACPVLQAHLLWNYDECNKPESVLHKMIPRGKDGFNERCIFWQEPTPSPTGGRG